MTPIRNRSGGPSEPCTKLEHTLPAPGERVDERRATAVTVRYPAGA
jgi:hypothetical protein